MENGNEVRKAFADSAEREISLLRESYEAGVIGNEDGALELYMIKVHAMKNSAAVVGDQDVSLKARELEYAARDGDRDLIREKHDAFTGDYLRLAEDISREIYGDSKGKDKVKDREALKDLVQKLKTAMDDFDTITLSDISFELENSEFETDEIRKTVSRLLDAIRDFDQDLFETVIIELNMIL